MEKIRSIPEILRLIVAELHSKSDKSTLCQVSKNYYTACIGLFYEHVTLNLMKISRMNRELFKGLVQGMRRNARHVKMLDVLALFGYHERLVEALSKCLLPLPNVISLTVDPLEDEDTKALLQALLPKQTYLRELQAAVGSYLLFPMSKIYLRSLILRDIYLEEDYRNTMRMTVEMLAEMQHLRMLDVDHAEFGETDKCKQIAHFPQLKHLELRDPRSMGFIYRLCSTLETLVLHGVTEQTATQVVSQSASIATLQLQLIGEAVLSTGLAEAIAQSGQNIREIWIEGSHRRDPDMGSHPRSYLQVQSSVWYSLARRASNLEVLGFDYPTASGDNIDILNAHANGLSLRDLLSPPLRQLRRLILICCNDEGRFGEYKFDFKVKEFFYNHLVEDLYRTRNSALPLHRPQIFEEIWLDTYKYHVNILGGKAENVKERISIDCIEELGAERTGEDFIWTT